MLFGPIVLNTYCSSLDISQMLKPEVPFTFAASVTEAGLSFPISTGSQRHLGYHFVEASWPGTDSPNESAVLK